MLCSKIERAISKAGGAGHLFPQTTPGHWSVSFRNMTESVVYLKASNAEAKDRFAVVDMKPNLKIA